MDGWGDLVRPVPVRLGAAGLGILSLPFDGAVRAMMLFFAVIVAAVACGVGWLETMSNTSLPVLDHTPRMARVREIRE